MTGEDEDKQGKFRVRDNVIHEAGLFQGHLGWSKAIVLLEEGAEEFSNIHGIQQIRFAHGHIASTFGEVLATIAREFPS
jgi:predicted nucleotide-binding protein